MAFWGGELGPSVGDHIHLVPHLSRRPIHNRVSSIVPSPARTCVYLNWKEEMVHQAVLCRAQIQLRALSAALLGVSPQDAR